jgi:ABC-type antimicrobial peptide transport system permease subunit
MQIQEALGRERLLATISGFLGTLALSLVAVGLYGTLSYAVGRRTSEIGIRMALGARRSHVVWMVMRESLLVVGSGLAVGLPASFALTRFIAKQLFGVAPRDPATTVATVLILALVASIAACIPASRAARIDPIRALRYE